MIVDGNGQIDDVDAFLVFVFSKSSNHGEIVYQYKKCYNVFLQSPETVGEHRIIDGFKKSYTIWVHHGEYLFPSGRETSYQHARASCVRC